MSVGTVQLWVSGILAILRVLISQSTEDIILCRVQELCLSPYLLSCSAICLLHNNDSSSPTAPPAADVETNGDPQRFLPEETFARWDCFLWKLFLEPVGTTPNFPSSLPPLPYLFLRFLLQLVGVLLDEISSKQVKVDMTEHQHTFYCQQLGTLLMCLIHIFKSGI